MKRVPFLPEREPFTRWRGLSGVVAVSLGGVLAFSAACSGDVDGEGTGPLSPGSSSVPADGTLGPSALSPTAPGTAGPDSTVPGPVGTDPTMPGPVGTDPTMPGPAGTDPTMPGPAGTDPTMPTEEDPNAIPAVAPESLLVPTSRLARLSRKQWSNTVRDLLHLEDISEIDADVSGDALNNFDSEGDALYVTEQLRSDFATAAELLAERVTADPTALALLVPADAPEDLAGRAEAFVTSLGLRAFRRPLTDAEVDTHIGLFDRGPELFPGVEAFEAGANLVIQAMLQSPHFLYRTELVPAPAGATSVPLSDYEVASKLAFALTNTMPDEELFAAAAAGELQDRANVTAHAERLLDGDEGGEGVGNFNFQVFRLGTYDGIDRDPEVFPAFTPETPAAMRSEVQHFFDWAFREGLGVRDYYTSPVGFVNSTLAPIYGLEGDFTSDTFTQVDLDPTQRSGFLTQAGFLSSYISDNDPDIIHRGVFIATRLLCVVLPPPSPDAGPLIDIQPDMTNRERVEATTGRNTCGEVCHSTLLNPLGYAFENYDALGQFRTMDRGLPVDAADSYSLDGATRTFSNGVELSQMLSESKQLHRCYAGNMMTYLHGRPLATDDAAIVDYYARLSRAGMISVRDLELSIVTSDSFLSRLP